MMNITVEYKSQKYHWESDGNETIEDMVRKNLPQKGRHFDFMLFKSIPGESYLNLGLPTRYLDENEPYLVTLEKPSKYPTIGMVRKYKDISAGEVDVQSFDVEFQVNAHPKVSVLQSKTNVRKLRVNFFPGETFEEAFKLDGRYGDQLGILGCDLQMKSKVTVYLTSKAEKYAEESFMLIVRERPNTLFSIKQKPIEGSKKPVDPVTVDGASNFQIVTPKTETVENCTVTTGKRFQGIPVQLVEYIEKTFVNSTGKNEAIAKHEKFALNFKHKVFLSDLVDLEFSIGAVIAETDDQRKNEVAAGTCFRIGKKFVITNNHVYEEVKCKHKLKHVDFNYKENKGKDHIFHFESHNPIFLSGELDYAIFALKEDTLKLPVNLADLGYQFHKYDLQGGERLTIIGHNNSERKQADVSCPLKTEENIITFLASISIKSHEDLNNSPVALEVVKAFRNPNTASYDVSTSFHGSSGSPGILISEKVLLVLHSRGVHVKGTYVIEYGTLISVILEDVRRKIQNMLPYDEQHMINSFMNEMFGKSPTPPTPMETDN